MRWIFRAVAALLVALVLLVAGLAVLPFVLPGEKIAQIAADQVKARNGRDLSVSGEVKFTFWPVLGVTTGPVSLGNADWAGSEPMLRAKALTIGLAAPDLLQGNIRITEIVAQSPDLRLETRADGRGNWEFSAPGAPSQTAAGPAADSTPLALEKLQLSDARLTWAAAGAAPVILGNVDLALDWPDPQGAADINATLRQTGTAVEISARIERFAGFLSGGVTNLRGQVTAPGGTVDFDGRAGTAGEAAGRLMIKASDSARFLAALGGPGMDLPKGLGQRADLSADMTYTTDARLALRDLVADLDGNRITGAADIALGARPNLTARLQAGVLDLTTVTGGGSGAANTQGAAEGWSTTAIDASALDLVDGTISLSAQGIRTATTEIGPIRAQLSLDRARAVLDVTEAAAFGGQIAGQLVANNRGGFSVRGDLNVTGIEVQTALRDLAGIERLSGKADGRLEFLGSGASQAAIMRSLSGGGRMAMGRGVISGFDLGRLMQGGEPGSGTTVFDSLTASFTIRDGDLFNNDLLLSLPNYRADGTGRVGLGARDLDYLFTPVALRANAGQGFRFPVRIKGPWANPRIIPDLEAVLKQELDIDREKLEDEAKEKLREKLQEKLNLDANPAIDPKEALKDKLESEAKKGLLRLLGGD